MKGGELLKLNWQIGLEVRTLRLWEFSQCLKINGFDSFGESIDIEVNTHTVELIREMVNEKKLPFGIKAMLYFR